MKIWTIPTLAIVASLLLVPAAASSQSWCAEGLCVNHEDDSYGEGSCEDAAEYYQYRGYSATYQDDSTVTGAYVYQFCWSYHDGESGGQGNALSVAVTRINWETFNVDGVILFWDSGEWDGQTWCGMMVHAHLPAIGFAHPIECVAGDAPPTILPSLP